MEIAAKTTIVLFVFLFAIVAGGILLQVFLSRREGKWRGWSCRFCRSSILW